MPLLWIREASTPPREGEKWKCPMYHGLGRITFERLDILMQETFKRRSVSHEEYVEAFYRHVEKIGHSSTDLLIIRRRKLRERHATETFVGVRNILKLFDRLHGGNEDTNIETLLSEIAKGNWTEGSSVHENDAATAMLDAFHQDAACYVTYKIYLSEIPAFLAELIAATRAFLEVAFGDADWEEEPAMYRGHINNHECTLQ